MTTDVGESVSTRMIRLLSKHDVLQSRSLAYTPEQNGYIERAWQTISTMATAMLADCELERDVFWEEACRYAVFIR